MKLRRITIAPGSATPGMVLAKPVVDHDGNTLLAAGTELGAELIERLLRRRTQTVCVDVADPRDAQTIANELRAARERVEAIFAGPGSAARDALRAAILAYREESTQ
jgi:hypothetical protein